MKKIVLAVAIAMAGAWGIFQANDNNAQLSDLQMENVELLAFAENPLCPHGCLDRPGYHCFCYQMYQKKNGN